MKAAICTKYGAPSLLRIIDKAQPTPKENQVLVKIHATSVTSGDARIRRADPFVIRLIFGWKHPRKSVLGVVVAGEVSAVGSKVSKFKVGDPIFGTTGMSFGAHAEYQCIDENGTLALLPQNMNYQEAAAIPFGATAALHFLKKAKVQAGHKVLIYGASGAIGTAAIQLAREMGAEVTAVCSRKNFDLVKSLGADKTIDYTAQDYTKNEIKYDVIFETVGKSSFGSNLRALKRTGTLLLASAGMGQMMRGAFTSLFGAKKVVSGVIKENAEGLEFIQRLIETGKFKPVIDSIYPLEAIARAHEQVDTGHKRGNVIVTMQHAL